MNPCPNTIVLFSCALIVYGVGRVGIGLWFCFLSYVSLRYHGDPCFQCQWMPVFPYTRVTCWRSSSTNQLAATEWKQQKPKIPRIFFYSVLFIKLIGSLSPPNYSVHRVFIYFVSVEHTQSSLSCVWCDFYGISLSFFVSRLCPPDALFYISSLALGRHNYSNWIGLFIIFGLNSSVCIGNRAEVD